MEKNSRYFIIGIFVIAALAALTFFVVWLAGAHDKRQYERYTIYFNDPVSGLKTGGNVQYRGVDVGRVLEVRLSPGNNQLIKVDVEVDVNTPITQSSEASLATQGITNLVFIDLTTPETASAPPAIPPGEKYPVIRGRGTQLSKLFQDIPQITTQILEVSKKLNAALSDDALASLDQTMKNIEAISRDMGLLLSEENIANTTAALNNVARSSEGIDELVGRFERTAEEIDRAINALNEVLTDNKQHINRFAGSGLRQITEMSRETKEMAQSIRRLADRLEQDPSQIIYKPNYRGVEIDE